MVRGHSCCAVTRCFERGKESSQLGDMADMERIKAMPGAMTTVEHALAPSCGDLSLSGGGSLRMQLAWYACVSSPAQAAAASIRVYGRKVEDRSV